MENNNESLARGAEKEKVDSVTVEIVDKSELGKPATSSHDTLHAESEVIHGEKPKISERLASAKRRLYGCGFFLSLGFLFLLFIGGLSLGLYYSNNLGEFLESRGIRVDWLSTNVETVNTSVITKENKVIQVTSEESRVIEAVRENMHSVVSIAISQLELQPGAGVVDVSNNIGSGFIVDENGLIITNQHVVSSPTAIYKVITENGDEYEVIEITRDDANDIALLKIEARGLNSVELGDSDNLIVGQTVIAIGTPLGEYAGSVTTGVISGLNRSVSTGSGGFFRTVKTFEDVIQTDAAVNPGNSGGPLLNSSGEVIGINFATTSGADNISFAIPINRVTGRLKEYRAYGKFLRPFVGIEYQMISEAEARLYENVNAGAFVRNVVDRSPAQAAGILRGDLITEIGGKKVTSSFVNMIQEYKVGDEVKMKVQRGTEELQLTVLLGEAD